MTCMQYIAFDFETSGLPEGRRNVTVTSENVHKFDTCRAVSLSAARFSQRGRLIDTFDAIILPTDFTISEDSIKFHGITQEHALREGRPFVEVFTDFIKFIGPRTKTLVAHNATFDTGVMRSEMIRHKINLDILDEFNIHCTLKIYKERFMKTIKLIDLYREIFNENFENAHNSLADSIACGRVYPYLIGHTRVLKPIGVPEIIIRASNVAAAVGVGYKKQPELTSELWKKYSPTTFSGKTEEERAIQIINSNDTTKRVLEDAETFESNSSSEVNQKVRAAYYQIENSGLAPRDMILAKEHVRKTLCTHHGTRNEDKTADEDHAVLVKDDTFYEIKICEIEGTVYKIVGCVDRIQINEDGTRTLVEIKNRTKQLFNRVRDYENIQCQTYLQMLKNIEYCRLIEQYNDEKKGYLIVKNNEFWNNEIVPKLQNFCEHFHSMLSESV